jgi:hypothetical protein
LSFVGSLNTLTGVEVETLRQRRSLPWRHVLLVFAALIAVALVASVVSGFFWLRGYQTLRQESTQGSNPGDGVMVEPPIGSGGTDVFFPRYRENGTFRVEAGVANHGRFTVTIFGLPEPDREELNSFQPFRLVAAEVSPPKRPSYYGSPIDASHPIRLRPGEYRDIVFVYRFTSRCVGGQPPRYWTLPSPLASYISGSRTVPLRVKYARWFEKTQNISLPFAITLGCKITIAAPRG